MKVAKHKPSRCAKLILRLCHCMVIERCAFHQCCGWYCDTCGGRIVDEARTVEVRR